MGCCTFVYVTPITLSLYNHIYVSDLVALNNGIANNHKCCFAYVACETVVVLRLHDYPGAPDLLESEILSDEMASCRCRDGG